MADNAETQRRPGRPRSQEADAAILGAALDLLIECGAAEASIEQVAQRAGVTRATVYRRFANKTDLLIQAIESGHADHVPPSWPDIDRMLAAWADYLSRLRNRRMLRRLYGSWDDYPELPQAYSNLHGQHRAAAIRATLQQARDARRLPPGSDVAMIQQVLSGAVLHHLDAYPDTSSADDIRTYLTAVLRQVGYQPVPSHTGTSEAEPGAPAPVTNPTGAEDHE